MRRMPRLDLATLKQALSRRRNLLLLGILVLLLAARIALPYVLRREIVSRADQALTGQIELDNLDLSLWKGGVTLHGLRVYAQKRPPQPAPGHESSATAKPGGHPEGAVSLRAPVFSVSRLWVEIGWLALLRKTLNVREIALDSFAVRLDRAHDGGLVIPRPLPSATPTPPKPEPKGSPWKVLVSRLRLRDGQIGFRDFAVAEKPQEFDTTLETMDAEDLALVIDASGAQPGKINLDAQVAGGAFALEASYAMKPTGPALDAHITLGGLPISGLRVYLPDLGWSDLRGLFSARIHHLFELGGAHHSSGTLTLTDVAVTVPGVQEPPLGWKKLSVEVGRFDLVGRTAAVSSVLLEGAHVLLDPQGKTFVPAVQPRKNEVPAAPAAAATPSSAPIAPAEPPWTWKVSAVEVKSARVDVLGGSRPLALAVDAKLGGFSNDLKNRVPISLTVGEEAGSFAVDGGFTVTPPGFDGSIRIADLALGPLVEPFAPAIGHLLRGGAGRAELQL
ncbi:MAG TPA: DUF748 domain-containing protein, partial [Myxococcota bacterium]|nr:DUF748 domain-containing protein [Myxococcota bacterium]